MSNPLGTLRPPLEPDPERWLTDDRRRQLFQQFEPVAPLLRRSGLWRAVLGYWVRWQASLDANWTPPEEEACIIQLVDQWMETNSLDDACLTSIELQAKLRVSPAAARWSRQQWGHRLDSLYLESKSKLDMASCRLLRIKDKNLALELYHRIKADETTFENAARDFGQGPERLQGGLIPLQSLEQMPYGLAPLLARLKVGQLSMPLRLDPGYCLVQLERFKPSQLDEGAEERLLAEQLRLWIDSVVDVIVTQVLSHDHQVPNESE